MVLLVGLAGRDGWCKVHHAPLHKERGDQDYSEGRPTAQKPVSKNRRKVSNRMSMNRMMFDMYDLPASNDNPSPVDAYKSLKNKNQFYDVRKRNTASSTEKTLMESVKNAHLHKYISYEKHAPRPPLGSGTLMISRSNAKMTFLAMKKNFVNLVFVSHRKCNDFIPPDFVPRQEWT